MRVRLLGTRARNCAHVRARVGRFDYDYEHEHE